MPEEFRLCLFDNFVCYNRTTVAQYAVCLMVMFSPNDFSVMDFVGL